MTRGADGNRSNWQDSMLEVAGSAELMAWIIDLGPIVYALLATYALFKPGTLALFAGIAAQGGLLEMGILVPLFIVGTFVGDGIKFFLGRRYGVALLNGWPAGAARAQMLGQVLARHHRKILMSYRLCFGIRVLLPIAAGISPLPVRQYLIVNLISSVVWNAGLLGLGYGLGQAAEGLFGDRMSLAALLILGGSFGLSLYIGRRLHRGSHLTG